MTPRCHMSRPDLGCDLLGDPLLCFAGVILERVIDQMLEFIKSTIYSEFC